MMVANEFSPEKIVMMMTFKEYFYRVSEALYYTSRYSQHWIEYIQYFDGLYRTVFHYTETHVFGIIDVPWIQPIHNRNGGFSFYELERIDKSCRAAILTYQIDPSVAYALLCTIKDFSFIRQFTFSDHSYRISVINNGQWYDRFETKYNWLEFIDTNVYRRILSDLCCGKIESDDYFLLSVRSTFRGE